MNKLVVELCCNIDDMTAEAIGYAMDTLLEAGAVDVYTQPIYMKKNRPATMLTVMCNEQDEEKMAELIFKHTTTIGVRKKLYERYVLDRRTEEVNTPYGTVKKKISEGYGVKKEKYEYDDIAKIAKENDLTFAQVLDIIKEK